MKLLKKNVLSENLDFFDQDINSFPYLKNITEHYRLLSYIAKMYDDITIIDAGTNYGHSCKALAQNKKIKYLPTIFFLKPFLFLLNTKIFNSNKWI